MLIRPNIDIMQILRPGRKYFSPFKHAAKMYLGIRLIRIRCFFFLKKMRKKKKIRVVFLVIHSSTWKVDSVYRKMAVDDFFDPEILVCPYVQFGEERMTQDMDLTYNFFKEKGYSVRKAQKKDGAWIHLHELNPDLVVFTNSNEVTRREYYLNAYSQYLSCYVPYYFMATNHAGAPKEELDKPMLNAMWRIYWPHRCIFDQFGIYSQVRGKNSRLTGYPAIEGLIKSDRVERSEVWKAQDKQKKRIIYAPHHTISEDESSLSTFLRLGLAIKKIAEQYKEAVQWSFKPHPILKSKLYLHPDWGRDRADIYYSFWSSQDYSQLDEGEYEDLFVLSDAIIHDCSSFIVEYAVTRKPGLYLVNKDDRDMSFLNDFGKCAFRSYKTASAQDEVNEFVLAVIEGMGSQERRDNSCLEEYLAKFYGSEMPSDRIIEDIKVALGAAVN